MTPFAALALRTADATRTLVLLFSDGLDTSSILSEDRVLEIARRSDAIVYTIGIRQAPVANRTGFRLRLDTPVDHRFLEHLSQATAGRLLYAEQNRDIERTFARVLDEFNARYVLGYAARSVAGSGWHRLEVRLKKRSGTVLARERVLRGVTDRGKSEVRGSWGEAMRSGFQQLVRAYRMHAAMLLCLVLFASLSQSSPSARPAPAPATLQQLAWLPGEWRGTTGRSSLEERWTPAAGGAMLAVSRTVDTDRLVAFEFLRIVERDGGLVYIAQPNGRPPTEFVLTRIDAGSATFENPGHDYPTTIRYARRDDGSLEATISGANGEKAQSFVFTREAGR